MVMVQDRILKTRQEQQQQPNGSCPEGDEHNLSDRHSEHIAKLEAKIASYDRELLQYRETSRSQPQSYRVGKKLKERAMVILRRKRQAEQQRDQLEHAQSNLHLLDCQLEMTRSTMGTVAALSHAKNELRTVCISDVDDMALDWREMVEEMEAVDAAMGDPNLYGVPELDETDLEAEFLLLEDEFGENHPGGGGDGGADLPIAPRLQPGGGGPRPSTTASGQNGPKDDDKSCAQSITSRRALVPSQPTHENGLVPVPTNPDRMEETQRFNENDLVERMRQLEKGQSGESSRDEDPSYSESTASHRGLTPSFQQDESKDDSFVPLPPPTNPDRIEEAQRFNEDDLEERLMQLAKGQSAAVSSQEKGISPKRNDTLPSDSFCFALDDSNPTLEDDSNPIVDNEIGSIQGIPEESVAASSRRSLRSGLTSNKKSTDESSSNASLFRPAQYPPSITSASRGPKSADLSVGGMKSLPSHNRSNFSVNSGKKSTASIATPQMKLRGVNPSLATVSHEDESRFEDASLSGLVVTTTRDQPLDHIDEESVWTDCGNKSLNDHADHVPSLERCRSSSSSQRSPSSTTTSVHVHLHLPVAPSGSPRIRTRSLDTATETHVWLHHDDAEHISSSASTQSWNNTTIDRRPDTVSVTGKSVQSFTSVATPEILRNGNPAITGLTPVPRAAAAESKPAPLFPSWQRLFKSK